MMLCTFDGACEPRNPGGAIAWAFTAGDTRRSGFVPAHPENTNNVAEYYGLLALLRYLGETGTEGPLEIFGDSSLVVKQVKGECRVHNKRLGELLQRAYVRLAWLEDFFLCTVKLHWIPREQNMIADGLVSAELVKHGIVARRY